jgi:ABC-type sugar transport system ATPase subunit
MVREREERAAVSDLVARVRLRTGSGPPRLDSLAHELSGGNQQKLALARCLLAQPRLLVLHEPTRGVDVGAKRDIHRLLREAADGGMAILIGSSELDELCALADRLVAFAGGRIATTLDASNVDRGTLARAVLAGSVESRP